MNRFFVILLLMTVMIIASFAFAQEDPPMPTPLPVPPDVQPTPVEFPKPVNPTVTIAAVGDMMIGNWGESLLQKHGTDYPFEQVRPYLIDADIATGNLEGPHCTCGDAMEKKFTFRMPPHRLDGYKNAGFDVMTVGNNHAMDYGADCFIQSNREVAARGMKICGGGENVSKGNRPAVVESNGITVAFLGYSATYPKEAWAGPGKAGTIFPERNRVIRAVEKAAAENDLVVVHFHWGGEGRQDPKDYQMDLAHLAIDHGADLVIGHHPHILQGIEAYKGKLIFYSLGNFIFASYSKRAKTSAIAQVTLNQKGELTRAKVIPVNVFNYDVHLQPVPLPGDRAILDELRQISHMIPRGRPAIIKNDGTVLLPE